MNNQLLSPTTENDTLLMQLITESLLDLGFNPKLKGFTYIKEAIYIYIEKSIISSISKEVYEEISVKYKITSKSLVGAVRKSLDDVWCELKLNTSHELFKCAYIKPDQIPTCKEFIATIAEIIKLKII